MQFSENQKYYLKRFAALHMPEIGRKAAYVRQELKTTWMAVDSTSVPDGVVYVYHNKEYKHIEDIVADVLNIHGDSAKIMQINNSRLACGLPTFVTWEKAETLYTIPGDKEKRDDASANSRWLKARAELDAAIQQVAETDKRLFQAESALISVRNIDSKSFHSMGVGMARDKRFLYSCEPGGQ